jgi:hypothetical protein
VYDIQAASRRGDSEDAIIAAVQKDRGCTLDIAREMVMVELHGSDLESVDEPAVHATAS